MSETLERVVSLIAKRKVEVSVHAVRELSADGLAIMPLLLAMDTAFVVEDYPDYHKGPSVLVLLWDEHDQPVHLVWGIAKGNQEPAVLVTAYRPDPDRWHPGFTRRKER